MQVVPMDDGGNPVELAVLAAGGDDGNGNGNGNVEPEERRYLKERVEKKEEQVLAIEANVFQVANYYLVFQAVIAAAFVFGSSSSSLNCGGVWIPLCLTLIGAMVDLGALYVMAVKYGEALEELYVRDQEVCNVLEPGRVAEAARDHDRRKAHRRLILILYVFLFLALAAVNLAAATLILCF